ncbi:hypothetical protein BS47DRAFT_1305262, partial [Hydnum rufescens UP504]
YAPWSLRYSGHHFGTWAGQLGDGRAISNCAPRIRYATRSQLINILMQRRDLIPRILNRLTRYN